MIPYNFKLPISVKFEEATNMRPMWEAAKKHFGERDVVGVEVGTSAGMNMVQVFKYWKNLQKLWCVDFYPTYSDFRLQEDQDFNLAVVQKNLLAHPRAHLIMDKSVEAAKMFAPESVDFVYIDANHSYTYVRDDIQTWLPKVKKGGIIGGHDYDWSDAEFGDELAVKRAVDEAFGDKVQYHIELFQLMNEKDRYNPYTGINSDWWVFL